MQSTLLFSVLAFLGLGLTFAVLRRNKSRSNSFASRMPIELDFDAAKNREQKHS